MKLPVRCATLWIGSSLGSVERACLRSVLRQGHALDLYCYDPPSGVPAGVELRDAADILPRSSIVQHQSGSVALFSDRFRYELQRRGLGTWVDCDAYLFKPLDDESPYLMGWQEPGIIAIGILRIPQDSPLLPPLFSLFEERHVPPWLPPQEKISAYWRLLSTGRTGLSMMPWGSAGPIAITALSRDLGLDHFALPPDIFYPVSWQGAGWIRLPERKLEDVITHRTVSLHLWNELIKHFKEDPAPPGSFLARIQDEGRV